MTKSENHQKLIKTPYQDGELSVLIGCYAVCRAHAENLLKLEEDLINDYLEKFIDEINQEIETLPFEQAKNILLEYFASHSFPMTHHYTKSEMLKTHKRIGFAVDFYYKLTQYQTDSLILEHAKLLYKMTQTSYKEMKYPIQEMQERRFFFNKKYEAKTWFQKLRFAIYRLIMGLPSIQGRKTINMMLKEITTVTKDWSPEKTIDVIRHYEKSFLLLNQYDRRELTRENLSPPTDLTIQISEAETAINQMKKALVENGEPSELFGLQRDKNGLNRILHSILQSAGGKYAYSSIEQQAANLLYFFVKDHIFADGNKRIGGLMFTLFLEKNKHHQKAEGETKINDNALVSLVLLLAESDPKNKETMIDLIINLIRN